MARKVFAAMLLLVSVSALCMADPDNPNARIRAFVDKRSVLIGDRVLYTLEVRSRLNMDVKAPDIKDARMGAFEVKDHRAKKSSTFFGDHIFINQYSLALYSIGKHIIPSLDVRYKAKESSGWVTLKTPEVSVTAASVLPKGVAVTDIKDIKGPMVSYPIGLIIAISVLFAALAAIIVRFILMRRSKISRPAHEIAIENLECIMALLMSGGSLKDYYVGISDCVRHYIETRFSLKAPEMTTEEFLDSLKDSASLSDAHKALMSDFLSACDLVKFAKYAPADKEVQNVYTAAKGFINETKENIDKPKVGK